MSVKKVLAPPEAAACDSPVQSWSSDGHWLVAVFGCAVVVYDAQADFERRTSFSLRYSAASIAVYRRGDSGEGDDKYELVVGTMLGAMLFRLDLSAESAAIQDVTSSAKPPIASAYADIAIGFVAASSDDRFIALGSVDGRVFVRDLSKAASTLHEEESGFGAEMLRRLLPSPRVTGLAFSPSNQELLVATRKGNVFVYSYEAASESWTWPDAVRHLADNPKSSSAAASVQTLATWWTSSVVAVCSRVELSQIELLDVTSGKTLHILDLRPGARQESLGAQSKGSSSEWSEQPLVTGMRAFRGRLLCHDSSCSVLSIDWPFLSMASLDR